MEPNQPEEYYHYPFGCFFQCPLLKSAKFVAISSLLCFIINLALLSCSTIESALHLVGEVSILLIELLCIVCLFYGLSHKKAEFLKPYLFFGFIWNVCLIVLWVLCMIQLFDQNGFRFDVFLNMSEFVELQTTDIETFESMSYWLTICLISGLTLTIIIGFWFMHIILSTYNYFVDQSNEIWDQQVDIRKLLVEEPPSVFIKNRRSDVDEKDPSTVSLLENNS